jgi:hypothetical protein
MCTIYTYPKSGRLEDKVWQSGAATHAKPHKPNDSSTRKCMLYLPLSAEVHEHSNLANGKANKQMGHVIFFQP